MNLIIRDIILPALAILPPPMTSIRAQVMLLAIGQQESGLTHRKQLGGGPARGLWQFERSGIQGVLHHPDTMGHAAAVCWRCGNAGTTAAVYHQLESDDILACAFARLLLWTVPDSLPGRDEAERAWSQYVAGWRPGKPRRDKWDKIYARAWDAVLGTVSA